MTDHIQLAYEQVGEGRPLVLVHGFCGSSAYWNKVREPLGSSYCVITPDLRGHGRSEAPDVPYTIEGMADDLADLIQQLQLDKPVLLGHSLGGYVTLAFVEKYSHLLSGFGLIHSTAFPDNEQGRANRNKAIASIQETGMEPFIDGLIPKLFAPEHLDTMSDSVQAAKHIGYATSPVGAIHTAEAMRDRVDRHHVLREAALPILLVAGGKDLIIPLDKAFSVQGDHISPVQLEQAGHMSMQEAPDALSRTIIEFVQTRC